eukprot:g35544.t1
MANVKPLFKKGQRQKTGNYTSVFGMILESIIKDEIAEYLEVRGKIGLSQHGFINLLEFFEELMGKLGKGEPVDMTYLNFQKAFDKVPHRRLLNKIGAYGPKGK